MKNRSVHRGLTTALVLSVALLAQLPFRARAQTPMPPPPLVTDTETSAPLPEALVEGPLAPQAVIPFNTRFSIRLHGAMILVGNTNMTCRTADAGCTGAQNATNNQLNDTFFMVYVDIDGNPTTFNSSSATLSIPAGAEVMMARLYWGGNAVAGVGGSPPPNIALSHTVKLATPAAGYADVTGQFLGTNYNTGSSVIYAAHADVTAQVRAGGSGAYSVANIQSGTGVRNDAGESGGLFAGWSLVVVYRMDSFALRSITLWDGFGRVEPNTQGEASIGGFVTPPTGMVNAAVGVVAWEGDYGLTGDHLQLNGQDLSGTLNPTTNFFNGTDSSMGTQVPRTPAYNNALGIDIDTVDSSNKIGNNQTAATITLPTAGDNYYPGVIALMVDVYEPDMVMTKRATDLNGGALNVNDIVRWTLTLTNTGLDASLGVVLRDPIPANMTYVPNSLAILVNPGGATGARTDFAGDDTAEFDAVGNRVVYRLGENATTSVGGRFPSGATATVQFDARVNAYNPPVLQDGTSLTNTGIANYYGETLGQNFTLTATATANVQVVIPDAAVVKTDAGAVVAPGETIYYTITASNASLVTTLTGVVLTETLPAYTTFAGTPGWAAAGAGVYVYAVGTLTPGASVNVPFAVRLSDSAPFTLTQLANIVRISDSGASGSDINPQNNVYTETTPVIFADLLISKFVEESVAVAGLPLHYTVRITNTGPAIARNVTMRDILPPQVTYVSNVPSQGSYDPLGNIWYIGSLGVNGVAVLQLTVNTNQGTTAGTLIVNTAMVTSTTDPIPPPPAVVTTPLVLQADLSITKDDGVTYVNTNQLVAYTIVVRNNGPSNVTGAWVTDTLPAGLASASWTCQPGPGASCSPLAGSGAINALVDLAAGARVTFTQAAMVGPCDTNFLVNTVRVVPPSGVTDPDTSNNTATDTDAIGPGANMQISKVATAAAVSPGSPLAYTIRVKNFGPDPATSVRVIENLPPSLLYQSSGATKGSFNPLSGVWTIGTLAVGETVTLTVNTNVNLALPNGTEVSNVATLLSATAGNAPVGAVATTYVGTFDFVYLPVVYRPDALTPGPGCCTLLP